MVFGRCVAFSDVLWVGEGVSRKWCMTYLSGPSCTKGGKAIHGMKLHTVDSVVRSVNSYPVGYRSIR